MFHYYQPVKVHFGAGQLNELGHACKGYGKTCFPVTTPNAPLQPLYECVKKLLDTEGISIIHFGKVEPNPNVEIVEQGSAMLKEQSADFVLAVGDGSSVNTAKAVAFANGKESTDWDRLSNRYSSSSAYYPSYSEKHLPLLSVPTTLRAGLQVTQATVITRGKEKITFLHPDNFSQETILDPQPMLVLPKRTSVATGSDASTYALENYIDANASPYNAMGSTEAIRLVIDYLPHVLEDLQNLKFRTNMCPAGTLTNHALANSDANAPHPLSETTGRIVYLPHEGTLTVALPAFIQYMADKNKERFADVAKLFGNNDLYTAMVELLETIGLHKKLRDFGVSGEDFQEILASPVLDHLPFGNREGLEVILKDSYA